MIVSQLWILSMTLNVTVSLVIYSGRHCQWLTNQACVGTTNTSFGCTSGHTANCIDHFERIDGKEVTVGGEHISLLDLSVGVMMNLMVICVKK